MLNVCVCPAVLGVGRKSRVLTAACERKLLVVKAADQYGRAPAQVETVNTNGTFNVSFNDNTLATSVLKSQLRLPRPISSTATPADSAVDKGASAGASKSCAACASGGSVRF